jgi:hypothetical protein
MSGYYSSYCYQVSLLLRLVLLLLQLLLVVLVVVVLVVVVNAVAMGYLQRCPHDGHCHHSRADTHHWTKLVHEVQAVPQPNWKPPHDEDGIKEYWQLGPKDRPRGTKQPCTSVDRSVVCGATASSKAKSNPSNAGSFMAHSFPSLIVCSPVTQQLGKLRCDGPVPLVRPPPPGTRWWWWWWRCCCCRSDVAPRCAQVQVGGT